MTLALQASAGKSYCFNFLDAPGHLNFSDEMACAARLADGALVVVDAVEGVTVGTQRALRYAVQEQLAVVLLVNKVDRLILELKLPPTDAYFKLKHTIEEVNDVLASCAHGTAPLRVSPELGNVCFGAVALGFVFSVQSFARIYAEHFGAFSPAWRSLVLTPVSVHVCQA
jgi:U5 small nuclear ribonucleoprotein component